MRYTIGSGLFAGHSTDLVDYSPYLGYNYVSFIKGQ